MTDNAEKLAQITADLRQQIMTEITWRYDERFDVMLSEFSQLTSINIIDELRKIFPDEWHQKNINATPIKLFDQLEGFNKLSKGQLLFSMPAKNSQPSIVAILWPWGHGGTFSLRLKVLENSYSMNNIRSPYKLINFIKSVFQ